MLVLCDRLKGTRFVPFSFVLCLLAVSPTEIGYQDIAALLARQPGVAERWQQHIFATSRRTMQVASFNLPRPLGTHVPETASYRLASLDSQGVDVTGSMSNASLALQLQASDFPKAVRSSKGDRLPLASAANSAPLDAELETALKAPRLSQFDAANLLQENQLDHSLEKSASGADNTDKPAKNSFSRQTTNIYFGNGLLGTSSETLERWRPGEGPIVMAAIDPDMKASPLMDSTETNNGGESIAGKGEVTGENKRPHTPAERLGLDAKSRVKAEKCLTDAIYFEARGEAVRGQIAVAQVVVNRAFSGYYPATVCGVVYQNANRRLSCQFTFACDGIRDVVDEPDMWERARKIAKETLEGRLWLPEVGKSTHYHAYWVRPSWVSEMKKTYKFGVHTFYRPRAWGDGSDAPSWGTAAQTAAISAELAADKP